MYAHSRALSQIFWSECLLATTCKLGINAKAVYDWKPYKMHGYLQRRAAPKLKCTNSMNCNCDIEIAICMWWTGHYFANFSKHTTIVEYYHRSHHSKLQECNFILTFKTPLLLRYRKFLLTFPWLEPSSAIHFQNAIKNMHWRSVWKTFHQCWYYHW